MGYDQRTLVTVGELEKVLQHFVMKGRKTQYDNDEDASLRRVMDNHQKLHDIVRAGIKNFFNDKYIVGHTASGKKPNGINSALPPLDEQKFKKVVQNAISLHPRTTKAMVVTKYQQIRREVMNKVMHEV